jgi:hypothetical protein
MTEQFQFQKAPRSRHGAEITRPDWGYAHDCCCRAANHRSRRGVQAVHLQPDSVDGNVGDAGVYRLLKEARERDLADLPSFPASDKKKDPRYGWFVENFGDRCWELDALDPNDVRACVEKDSALSTSGLRTLNLPKDERDVIVLAGGDGPDEAAARNCALRWKREGRRVRIARPPQGFDFNDVLTERAMRPMATLPIVPLKGDASGDDEAA